METWNPLYGTAVRRLQGLSRATVGNVGTTVMNDDGSSITYDDAGNVLYSTEAPAGAYSASYPTIPVFPGSTPGTSITGGNVQAQPSFWDSASSDLKNVLTSLISAKQTLDVNKLNMELIKTGRPPLTASQMQAVVPQVRVGVAADTQKMALIGVAVIAAAMILPKLLK